jgi:hypothetical protein
VREDAARHVDEVLRLGPGEIRRAPLRRTARDLGQRVGDVRRGDGLQEQRRQRTRRSARRAASLMVNAFSAALDTP